MSADRSSAELPVIMRMNCLRDGGFKWSAPISLSSAWCRRQRLSLQWCVMPLPTFLLLASATTRLLTMNSEMVTSLALL